MSAVRVQFNNGVSDSVLNQLLDKLLQHGAMINEEMQTAKTKPRAEKAPDVIDTVMRKGHESSQTLIEALREVDPCLSRELKLWSDRFHEGQRSLHEGRTVLRRPRKDMLSIYGRLMEGDHVASEEKTLFCSYCEAVLILGHFQRPGAVED
ncbi:unnamed protein product [Menidia menidia]|uniref:(Atlantic silverside) hypothetical protein n=1 Tax=Menidia menidia TaxID=238744 RepID=A0A8S4BQI3_9TELE|nr:unnamed protein product [Menidia menidia]